MWSYFIGHSATLGGSLMGLALGKSLKPEEELLDVILPAKVIGV
jgi:hypothetical protein